MYVFVLCLHVYFGVLQAQVDTAVKELLELKSQYKTLTGVDLAGGSGKGKRGKQQKENQSKQQKPQQSKQQQQQSKQQQPKQQQQKVDAADGGREVKKVTRFVLRDTVIFFRPCWYFHSHS